MSALLERLSIINSRIADLEAEREHLMPFIEEHVAEHGTAMGYGYVATFKPGRASTDHEAAAKAANVDQSLIEEYSTTKTTVKWAKVTKAAKVDVAPFTTRGEPTFVVEPVK
jgi:hypothetical protein